MNKAALTNVKEIGTSAVNEGSRVCVARGEKHLIWKRLIFRAWSTDKKWEKPKRASLCYQYLGDDHLGKDCKRSRVCSVTGCNHQHLLHKV